MLNLAKFYCHQPKTSQTTLNWGESGFFTEIFFLRICLNSFVRDCRLLIIFENTPPNCWKISKLISACCMLQIQPSPSYKSGLHELMLIFSIKIWYFYKRTRILPQKLQKNIFIFLKHPQITLITSKMISAYLLHSHLKKVRSLKWFLRKEILMLWIKIYTYIFPITLKQPKFN